VLPRTGDVEKGIMTTLERTLAIAVLAAIWLLLPV
jgi:hypothetical protein